MISLLKKKFPNIYIVLVAVAIGIWFDGLSILVQKIYPGDSISKGIVLCSIALLILYMDDGSLSELYSHDGSNKNKTTKYAAASASYRD